MDQERSAPAPRLRNVGVALQGGGSHGAFTWGALDRLLQEPAFAIDSVTGTSAGAMNAVVLADGLARGGAEEARKALRLFWESVASIPGLATFFAPAAGRFGEAWHLDNSPAYIFFDIMSRIWSPYDLNPLGYHPLRGLLAEQVDFECLRAQDRVRVMLCATNVHSGRRRIFDTSDVSLDAVLASACLPFVFPAVEIDGEPYWDGGYTGNPAIAPFLREGCVSDLIIIGINPLVRNETPRHAREIINRVNEISFNSTFWLELTAIAVILEMVDEGLIDAARVPSIRFHGIDAGHILAALGASSKMNNSRAFIEYLFGLGSAAVDTWLAENRAAIGKRSTLDLKQLLPVDFALFRHAIRASMPGDSPPRQ
jgi:NTE family protein